MAEVTLTDSSILVIQGRAIFDSTANPLIPADWVETGAPVLDRAQILVNGDVAIDIDPTDGRTFDTVRYAITFASGGESVTVIREGNIDDVTFSTSNAGAAAAFYQTLVSSSSGTVTISDDPSIQPTEEVAPLQGVVVLTGGLVGSLSGVGSLGALAPVRGTAALAGGLVGSLSGIATLGGSIALVGTAALTGGLVGSLSATARLADSIRPRRIVGLIANPADDYIELVFEEAPEAGVTYEYQINGGSWTAFTPS